MTRGTGHMVDVHRVRGADGFGSTAHILTPAGPGVEQVARTASRIAEAALLIVLVVLPSAFNPSGVLGFEPLKASLWRAAAVVLAVAWLTYRLSKPPALDVAAHAVVRAGLLVVALATLSTALSIEPVLSFFGTFDRGMGWLTTAAGGVLLLTTADLLADERRRERAIGALLLGSVVPCAYMLVQVAGLDPIHWAARGAPGSSLGSPTFLGGYLVIIVPFALYRVIGQARAALDGGISLMTYAGSLALLLVACAVIVLTTIRGPLLGLAVGVVTFAGVAAAQRRIGRKEIAGALALLLVAVVLAVAANGANGALGLQRFFTIGGAIDSSSERLTVWQDALRAPLADPPRVLFGFGDETQSTVLEQREATVRQTPAELWDRAHNLLLDTWLTTGLCGLAALLLVLAMTLRGTWRARLLMPRSLLPAAVLAALAGHLVEVSFAFHSVVTGALFWLLLGLAASLSPRLLPPGRRARPWAALIGVSSGLLLLPLMLTPALADVLYGSARRSNFEVGAQLEEQAAALAPWVEELPRAAALDWQQVAIRRNDDAARMRAEGDLRSAAVRAPLSPLPQVRLTRWFLGRGDLAAAEQACQRALVTGPYRAGVWDACAEVSGGRGLSAEAATRRARADFLRPPV